MISLYKEEEDQENYNKLTERFCRFLYEDEGKTALSYLEDRKFNNETIKMFNIGYCPKSIQFTSNKILNNLRGRVIFPIIDEFGDTVAFSGRYPSSESVDMRWWHEKYPKSFFLYGIDVTLPHILKSNFVFIVEGQTDVISCYNHGLKNVVGIMGSNLMNNQIVKISRFTTNFVFLFDADDAGFKAADKGKQSVGTKTEDNEIFVKNDYENIRGYDSYEIRLILGDKKYDPDNFLKEHGPARIIKTLKKMKERRKKSSDNFWEEFKN